MKEKIYTIPVNEAFSMDCECPLCELEKKSESNAVNYVLGPSLMEPEARLETNEKGFCIHHFEMLYDSKINLQGLGLIMETHLDERIKEIEKFAMAKKANSKKLVEKLVDSILEDEETCVICDKMEYTMERYIDVIFYLWSKESEFRDLFFKSKGFCIPHFGMLADSAAVYLKASDMERFLTELFPFELQNLYRIKKDIEWFNKKSDYRNADEPFGTSADAVPRTIEKIAGYIHKE